MSSCNCKNVKTLVELNALHANSFHIDNNINVNCRLSIDWYSGRPVLQPQARGDLPNPSDLCHVDIASLVGFSFHQHVEDATCVARIDLVFIKTKTDVIVSSEDWRIRIWPWADTEHANLYVVDLISKADRNEWHGVVKKEASLQRDLFLLDNFHCLLV